jgi:hypothetical protein
MHNRPIPVTVQVLIDDPPHHRGRSSIASTRSRGPSAALRGFEWAPASTTT